MVELFGGAMLMDVPSSLTDVSQLREIPDHQEVFASKTSDQNLIIEILEPVDQQNQEAVKYHFEQVAEINESLETQVVSTEPLGIKEPLVDQSFVLVGCQKVAKFREQRDAGNSIVVLMALMRIGRFQADLLVTMNLPLEISQKSSSFESVKMTGGEGLVQSDAQVAEAKSQFIAMVRSLVIKDTGLFG
ncbi:hypothetical protein LPJ56_005710 [Coemansia sp. RSA 2599]|nr:hypothetical protein LPJ75_005700 [Coemansia sp. RSA 2598]KAJ1811795.1 hypothetical protein LPJ56_005710 [Coemansia sp. RSA 2599]